MPSSTREWLDSLACDAEIQIDVLPGHDRALIGVAEMGSGPMAVYEERALVASLLAESPEWTEQDAKDWIASEIIPAVQVIVVETPPQEEPTEAPTSIRDALVDRVVKAARALREHRSRTGDGAKAWAAGLVGQGPRAPLNLAGVVEEGKKLNAELDSALEALDTYERRTA